MKQRYSLARLAVVLLLVLLLSAAWTVPAMADDGAPPPEEAPVETTDEVVAEPQTAEALDSESDTGGEPATEAPPAEETAPEEPPVAETPAEDGQAGEPLPEAEAPAALLAEVPEGTEVVVTDGDGEALPLATAEAAEAVGSADPMWCPEGVTPNAGVGGCTASYTSLNALITYLAANQQAVNGVIWIEKGYDSGVDDVGVTVFTLDGSGSFATMAAYRLTVQGGWEGEGTKNVDTSDPSEINARFNILNWGADVTLNDLLITSATGAYALQVITSGKVNLNRVKVNNNASWGALVNNTSGTSDVMITLSEFSNNTVGSDGLQVYSSGMITLADVIASGNDYHGANLDNSTAPTPKNVVMTSGAFEFNGNGDDGLVVSSAGAITLKDIVAVGNGYKTGVYGNGATLNNTPGDNKPVTLLGTNVFSENDDGGLEVYSDGAVRANNLVANANPNGWGAYIVNNSASTAQPVTLTGTNEFKFNQGGLAVYSNGAITTSNLTANNSGSDAGVSLVNSYSGYSSAVTLTGTNEFLDNWITGLSVNSYGVIRASNLSVSGNGQSGTYGYGAFLYNAGASAPRTVILSGTNSFYSNYDSGLYIEASGAIIASNVSVADTQNGYGASLTSIASGADAPQPVRLTGTNAFNHNDEIGLYVYTYGAVTLNNLTANDNGQGGPANGAFINNYIGTKPQPVTLTGYGDFYNNPSSGLVVYSLGQITVTNLNAGNNTTYGATLRNNYTDAKGGVSVNGVSGFYNNGDDGLNIRSFGNIIVKDLDAADNGDFGVYLTNNYSGATGSVSVGTSRANWCNGFTNNQTTGLGIWSNGAVTLSNICANDNGQSGTSGDGVSVYNGGAATPKPVTITGSNSFNNNYNYGLYVDSKGAITAGNLQANDNQHTAGVYLGNTASGTATPQNVTVTGSNDFHNNYGDGLEVFSYGNIKVNNAQASGNGWGGTYGYGLYLDGSFATLPRTLMLSGENGLYDNYSGGMFAASLGAITVSRLDASDNNGYGAYLINSYTGAKGGVTLSGYATFYNNAYYGLQVVSLGQITATNLEASNNIGYGANLDNDGTGALGGVTLTGNNFFYNNGGSGLEVHSLGAIRTGDLRAWDNTGSYGVLLDNSAGAGPVTLSGGPSFYSNSFGNNSIYGLMINSAGAVVAKDLYAESNGNNGVTIVNNFGGNTMPMNVTLNGSNQFDNNFFNGLNVDSYGQVTLNNVTARWNGQSGTSGDGVRVNNDQGGSSTLPRAVLLNGTNNFEGNYEDGLTVYASGAIRASRVTANGNGDDGAYLDNQLAGFAGTLTIVGYGTFDNNGYRGLEAFSYGNVTLNNLNAGWNWYDGALIDTYSVTTGTRTVTLTGTSSFLGNGQSGTSGNGLNVYADGLIRAASLTASWNYGYGAILDNNDLAWAAGGIDLTGKNVFSGNGGDGLVVQSTGNITLNNLVADNNGQTGVVGTTTADITISCGSLTANTLYGWNLDTPGTATLKGVFAFGNGTANGWFTGSGVLVTKHSCP